jgi:uncharacterized membrane protein
VVREAFSLRSSRYPAPKDLREYEQIYPGFTGEMLELTKRETDHRLEQEKLQTKATIRLANRGQLFGFITVMTLAGGSIAGILTGHSVVGLAGIVVAAATLVGAFVAPNIFGRKASIDQLQSLETAEEASQLSQEQSQGPDTGS